MNGKSAPVVSVGIVTGSELNFTLDGDFFAGDTGRILNGRWKVKVRNGRLMLTGDNTDIEMPDKSLLIPSDSSECSFTMHAVTIGVDFHWQRNEDQVFRGSLKFITGSEGITAVNILPVEDYLVSVISSEMSATSSVELLKAHAVISRSWLLAQLDKSARLTSGNKEYETGHITDREITRWYDREDHKDFDVCADDHCQRYQGITRASSPAVEKAVRETTGEVLMSEGAICDARYSKCCGGVTELFENVWEPASHPYLQKVIDSAQPPSGFDTDLEDEDNAIMWIDSTPGAFCNTADTKILSQVLNNYDQETYDFFRWKVVYSQSEISELVREKTGIDFGTVIALEPLTRGTSGRIVRLKITGKRKTMIIGKELEIRKALSKTHLYSSAFHVKTIEEGSEKTFVLHGAGWGHGVGLCQIGAAVMGESGYAYIEILSHYFVNSNLQKLY
jgi:stage II sporulation protein D